MLFVIVGATICGLLLTGCDRLNSFQKEGDISISGLKANVEVIRDEKGMAYIYAANEDDLLWAQGFVAAQDRLFQMEMTRLFVSGRISELMGQAGRESDVRMRTIGFTRQAKKYEAALGAESKRFLQSYIDGVNAYIARGKEIPLEFKLSGLKPQPWTIADSLAIAYFMGWGSAANIKDEVIAQMLVEKLGPEKAAQIFPVNINPDTEKNCKTSNKQGNILSAEKLHLDLTADKTLVAFLSEQTPGLRIGSNNWVVSADLSPNGKPVVVNDPHLDARMFPGPWHPIGLITPSLRAVGITIAGSPGIIAGRTDYVAFGVTNSYGDGQDLSIETIDPKNPDCYLEGNKSKPFQVLNEKIKIKDKSAAGGYREENIVIRLTKRGPVVSGTLKGLDTSKVISLRWSPFESMLPSLGSDRLMKARSASEFRESLRDINFVMLNFVYADVNGHYGWQTTGRLPIRVRGNGLTPLQITDERDDWKGWIPFDKMPHSADPARGWVGTCNHNTVPCGYPYYYTSHTSPSYRYRRLSELLDAPGKKSAKDHWQYQRDTVNLMAKQIAPIMAKALINNSDTKDMGQILSSWNYVDDPNQAAPAIFQSVYRHFFFAVYQDELGESLAKLLGDNVYFWQESLQKMVLAGDSPWFDDISTPNAKETRDDLFYRAGVKTNSELASLYGSDPKGWTWGRMHQITFVSPIRREGFGRDLLGGGPHAMGGSQETLYRASYDFNKPYDVTTLASLRMVADLGDPDKIMAVLPGGASGRIFNPHYKDQVEPFMNGKILYWWFSDKAIREHAKAKLRLIPQGVEKK